MNCPMHALGLLWSQTVATVAVPNKQTLQNPMVCQTPSEGVFLSGLLGLHVHIRCHSRQLVCQRMRRTVLTASY